MKSHTRQISWVLLPLLVALLFVAAPQTAYPGLWWYHGVRSRDISLCFAGNGVTARADRVRQIVDYLQRWEWAANIRFLTIDGTAIDVAAGPLGDLSDLACPNATKQPSGDDYWAGDVRVALWGTNLPISAPGKVPGVGCPQDKVNSSWSNPPDELDLKRSCQYNMVLGDDADGTGTPWLNHTLHEFGHALGLAHEHARADENAQCVPVDDGAYHATTAGYMTPYDKDSVMHYWWPASVLPNCHQTGSNYSQAGLTGYDMISIHILYPENARVAEFRGTTVIRTTDTLSLQSEWQARGANMSFVSSVWDWRIDGVTRSTTPSLSVAGLAAGDHDLSISHTDFLGRTYTYNGKVRVLTPADYASLAGAAGSAAFSAWYGGATMLPQIYGP